MESDQIDIIRKCCKDEASFGIVKRMFIELASRWKNSEKNLQLLESSIREDYDSILITELDLEAPGPKIVYVNDGFTRLTGYTREEVVGKTPRILQGPKTDRDVLERLKKSLQEGKSFFGQTINYRKDGTEFVNQWDIHPLYNEKGEITHWVSYQHDISKRKRAELTFHETNVEFDKLMEYSKRILVDFDRKGNIVVANKSFRKLTGYEKGELQLLKIWDIIAEDQRDSFVKDLHYLWEEKDIQNKKYKITFVRKNKITVETEVIFKVHEVSDNPIIRATIDNISLQKKVIKALESRNYKFFELMEEKSDFTYGLDISNPDMPKFTWISEGFEELTGLDSSEYIGDEGWQKLVNAKDIDIVKRHLNKVVKGRTSVEEYHIRIANGQFLNVLDYAKPDKDPATGEITKITGSILDPQKEKASIKGKIL